VAAATSHVSAGTGCAMKHAAMAAAGAKAAAVAAAASPAVPADAAAPAEAAAIGVAAPIPARAPPAIVIPAVILAAENELRVFDLRRICERLPRRSRRLARLPPSRRWSEHICLTLPVPSEVRAVRMEQPSGSQRQQPNLVAREQDALGRSGINRACSGAQSAPSPPFSPMNAMTASTPSPVFILAKTKGRSLRINLASLAITSSEAPT
jgi:hypothetical protein